MAWVTKHLQQVTEEYARVLLVRHAKYNPKSVPAYTYRKKWIGWLRSTCQLCGTKSRRRAILDRGLTCCAKCDKGIPKIVGGFHFSGNTLHPNLLRKVLVFRKDGGVELMKRRRRR
jgi:hypothetical protein